MKVNVVTPFNYFLILLLTFHSYFTWHVVLFLILIIPVVIYLSKLKFFTLTYLQTLITILLVFIIFTFSTIPYYLPGTFERDIGMVYLKLVLCLEVFFYFFLVLNNQSQRTHVIDSLTFSLKIHVFFFLIQFVFLYLFTIHIDPMALIGNEQRVQGALNFGFYRPSGFFNEPGTYFAFVSLILFARYMLIKKGDWLTWVTLFSFLLTLSVQAIIITPVIILIFLFLSNVSSIYKYFLLLFVLVISLVLFFFISEFLSTRLQVDDITILTRLQALNFYLQQSEFKWLLGTGIGVNNCSCLMADTGLWFTIISAFGLILSIPLIIFTYLHAAIIRKDLLAVAMLSAIYISKVEIDYYFLWVFIACFVFNNKRFSNCSIE